VMSHNHQLATWAQQMLTQRWGASPVTPLDGSLLGSMATVPLPEPLASVQDASKLQQRLYDEFGLEQPLVGWDGKTMIRVSCQIYNQPSEYEKLADVIQMLSKK
jgi:isopenicillin-N epimerase